jgi:hypothetical protein
VFTADEIDKLLRFIGYGRLEAPIWFIGMEEGGGGEANLRTRLTFDPVMDLARAQRMLGYGAYFDLPPPKIQPTWRALIQITLGVMGRPTEAEAVAGYQVRELGRAHGDTLLTELMPLPAPTTRHWPYQALFADPRFASRDRYLNTIKPHRIQLLRDLIANHKPRLVICYGKSYWTDFKRLFPGAKFQIAVLRQDPSKRGAAADTLSYGRTPFGGLAILLPHPMASGMNARWRMAAIVRLMRAAIQGEIKNRLDTGS